MSANAMFILLTSNLSKKSFNRLIARRRISHKERKEAQRLPNYQQATFALFVFSFALIAPPAEIGKLELATMLSKLISCNKKSLYILYFNHSLIQKLQICKPNIYSDSRFSSLPFLPVSAVENSIKCRQVNRLVLTLCSKNIPN